MAEKFFNVSPYNYTDNNPVNNIDSNGMETLYGEDAQNAFRQLQRQFSSQDQDDAPDAPKKKNGTSNFGQSFIDRIKSGLDNSWQGIKSQFTLGAYLKGVGNTFTFGAINSGEMVLGAYDVAKNIPDYNADDYAYGTGFVIGKLAEAYLTRIAISKVNYALGFNLNKGWGLFGKKGLNIGNYKIEALYKNGNDLGGTYLSVKELKNKGNLLRWDLGGSHSTGQMGYHSTFRSNINEKTYGEQWTVPFICPISVLEV